VSSIIDKQMIIAIQLEHIESEHETLQDRVRLKGDHTVQVAFDLGPKYSSINFAVKLLKKVILAQRLHVI